MLKSSAVLCLLIAPAFGQIQPTVPQPTNIDFSQGAFGQMPPGWDMPPLVLAAGYRAELRNENCGRFDTCVAYVAPPVIAKVRAAELTQTFPAGPYVGKAIRFSAWLRLVDASDGGYIHIRMRVDYANGKVDMRDSQIPPVDTPQWQQREVTGHVNPGAESISIWARYVPSGSAWVASPSFEAIDEIQPPREPTSFAVATGTFPVKDAVGQTIRYGAWIKTENVANGYAGLWWRTDGEKRGQVLSFDNSRDRVIDNKPAADNGVVRGATGSTGWAWYEIELPVPAGAHNINFGLLFDGTGTAWFDALKIEISGVPYLNPEFDFDFESPTTKGFPFAGDNLNRGRYKVGLDDTTAYTGRQSLKMQFVGDHPEPQPAVHPAGDTVATLDPDTADSASKSERTSTHALVNFINRSSTPVDIYWIGFDGNRILYRSELPIGATWQAGTFVTHVWLIIASGTGGTKEHNTGVRIAAFEALSAAGGDAIITDRR